jgi:hypothetical protein
VNESISPRRGKLLTAKIAKKAAKDAKNGKTATGYKSFGFLSELCGAFADFAVKGFSYRTLRRDRTCMRQKLLTAKIAKKAARPQRHLETVRP